MGTELFIQTVPFYCIVNGVTGGILATQILESVGWASESQYKFLRAFKQEAGDGLSAYDARLAAVQVRPLCAFLAQSEAHAGLAPCSKKFDIAISLALQYSYSVASIPPLHTFKNRGGVDKVPKLWYLYSS